ncbi:MAG: sulfurtransferase-like selenium metabolism protein YedF [Chloroflexi bacterium]|nr:sulfurtransferase-like selenium metabolism protein YedF [Chloroflexota bacterium]
MHQVDARGLACPQPVILVRRAMHAHSALEVLVSSQDSINNILRLTEKQGWYSEQEERDDGVLIRLHQQQPAVDAQAAAVVQAPKAGKLKKVVLLTSNVLGSGPQELGEILSRSLLFALSEVEEQPDTLIFMNSGVELVIEGSPALESLAKLQESGVEILACGTCLDYLDLRDRLAIGTVSNMYSIVEALLGADRAITL